MFSPSSMRVLINTGLLIASFTAPGAGYGADELRFDVTVLPEFRRYQALRAYPGYMALALENNGLSPSPGNKLVVKERSHGIWLLSVSALLAVYVRRQRHSKSA